jgi:hypothetical protein
MIRLILALIRIGRLRKPKTEGYSILLDDLELEELVDDCVREMREAGLLRPTLVKPGEHNLVIEDNPTSAAKGLNGDLPF